jgi:sec-independent protein translocase protein TatA
MTLGMTEIILILVIALIIFGPRKLPELGKSMGQAMFQFRKASDDFKRTWEQEVEFEKVRKDSQSTSASYDYNSSESNDPYNPYGDSETAKLPEQSSDNDVNPSAPSSGQDQQTAGEAAEPAASAAKAPEKQHWI